MIENFQKEGLEKLVNSSAIKDIYPMVDRIEINYDPELGSYKNFERFDLDIFINDPTITKDNMYNKEFDPHYLAEHHIKKYLPYFNIDKVVLNFIVWGPDGNIVTSYKH
jgi:hypothetical protein